MNFNSGHDTCRARKLEMASRHRARAAQVRRPIVDVLELKLAELRLTDYSGDSEIYGSLIANQRFQADCGGGS